MRKIIVILIIALMPVLAFGQEYEPFLKEGKTWKYEHSNPFGGSSYMYSRIAKGDTTINDLIYKKIYDVSSGDYQYALREDGKKVYCKFQNMNTPKLLYDFGKNAGEIISERIVDPDNDEKYVTKVISVDTVKSGDRLLRRMKVVENYMEKSEIYGSSYGTWIEGIGSSCDLVSTLGEPGNYNNFYSCWIGDDIIGDYELFSAPGISERPMIVEGRTWNVVDIIPAEAPKSESEPGYYKDIQGRWGIGVPHTFVLKGDTLMREEFWSYKKYKKLYFDGEFVCGLREYDHQIYALFKDESDVPEELVFDFNAQPGDIFGDGSGKIQVKKTSQVNIEGKSRRCMEMWNNETLVDYWIEGIGCMNGPYFPIPATSTGCLLLSCYDGDECIFNYEEFLASITTDINSPKTIQRTITNSDKSFYDLLGRKLMQSPQKGIYIQNGKKVIVK